MDITEFQQQHIDKTPHQKLNALCDLVNKRESVVIKAMRAQMTGNQKDFEICEKEIKEQTEIMNWLYEELAVVLLGNKSNCTKEEFLDIVR